MPLYRPETAFSRAALAEFEDVGSILDVEGRAWLPWRHDSEGRLWFRQVSGAESPATIHGVPGETTEWAAESVEFGADWRGDDGADDDAEGDDDA